jgi:capsular exopolysaccharide synthesis family protein
MNIILGFIVGVVGGIGITFLFENLNPRLYSLDQIEAVSELDVIGKIPSVNRRGLSGLFNHTLNIKSAIFRESFHKLQVKIMQQNSNGHAFKSILFTSAVPGEGKSTVVTHLALALAQTGQKVMIVDCDMRRPTIHKLMDLSNESGLSTILSKHITQSGLLQKGGHPNISVLTSGPVPSNPVELLGSPQMKALIEALVKNYDIVLLDTPAILPVGDALILSNMVDAITLVIRQTYSKEDAVRDACKQLAESNSRIIGVVVNEAKQNGSYYYYQGKHAQ